MRVRVPRLTQRLDRASGRASPGGQAGQDEPQVFRSAGAALLWWAWVVLAVLVLLDLAVQGRGRSAAVAALLIVAITGVIYATAWRSRVVADATGITVANPLRDHWIPWSAVEDVDAQHALRVHCAPPQGAARGRVVSSWAVQSSPRTAARKEFAARRAERRGGRAGGRAGGRPGALAGYGAPPPASGYARLTPEVREAMSRTPAEYAVHTLLERARRVQQAAQRAGAQPDGARPDGARPDGARPDGAQPVVRWAWISIAAMLLPTAAFLLVLFV